MMNKEGKWGVDVILGPTSDHARFEDVINNHQENETASRHSRPSYANHSNPSWNRSNVDGFGEDQYDLSHQLSRSCNLIDRGKHRILYDPRMQMMSQVCPNRPYPDAPPLMHRQEMGSHGFYPPTKWCHRRAPAPVLPAIYSHYYDNSGCLQDYDHGLSEYYNGASGFTRRSPPRVHTKHCSPVAGGAPLFTCCNCSELLLLSKKVHNRSKIRCGGCHTVIVFAVSDKRLAVSIETKLKVDRHLNQIQTDFDIQGSADSASASTTRKDSSLQHSEDVLVSKTESSATEIDLSSFCNTGTTFDSGEASRGRDHLKSSTAARSFYSSTTEESFKDLSRSSDQETATVTVNGHLIPDGSIMKAEKLAGPISPGHYWYDFRAGFWGAIGGPCLGIVPPFIEEFKHPMPEHCAGGNTNVYVNGRELSQKDLRLLASRGLPAAEHRSYIIEISGRVLDDETGEELESLGKLAPTVEKLKRGFGMKVPKSAA